MSTSILCILFILIQISLVYSSWNVRNNTCKDVDSNETIYLKGCSTGFDSKRHLYAECEMYTYTQHYSVLWGPWKDVLLMNFVLVSEKPVYNLAVPSCLYLANLTFIKSRKSIHYENHNNHFILTSDLPSVLTEMEELKFLIEFHKKRAYAIASSNGNCNVSSLRDKQINENQNCTIYIQAILELVFSNFWFQNFSANYTLYENVFRSLERFFFVHEAIIHTFKMDFAPSIETPEYFLKFVSNFNITELDLSNNHFDIIEKEHCPGFPTVTTLDLSGGDIKIIESNAFGDFNRLQRLNLSYNKLDKVPETVSVLSTLTLLDLSGNNITDSNNLKIPSEFSDTENHEIIPKTSITVLILRANHLITLKSFSLISFPKLQHLDLAKCSLVKLHPDVFNNCTSLDYLDLSENHLSSLPKNLFAGITSFKKLNLAKNFFVRFPDLQPIIFLKTLDVSHNFLTNISIAGHTQVEDMNLAHNNIKEWEHFINISKTKNLDLNINQISVVTEAMAESFTGVQVELYRNPFDCSPCSINLFYQWYSKTNFDPREFICDTPRSDRGKMVLSFSSNTLCNRKSKWDKFFVAGCILFVIGILCIVTTGVIIFRMRQSYRKL